MNSPDIQLSKWITGLAGHVGPFDRLMTLLASDFFIPVSMAILLLYLWFGTRDAVQRVKNQYGVMCASASLGIACLIVKIINGVGFNPWPRPFLAHELAANAADIVLYYPHDPSFPSNMAAVLFGTATGMWFYNRRASIPLFAFAIVCCSARIYAGVHYPLDILGGAAIGVVGACISFGLLKLLWPVPKFFLWLGRKLYLA